jgi:general secretion pathway protein D
MPLLSKPRHNAFTETALRTWLPMGGALLMSLAALPPAAAQSGKGGGSAFAEAELAKRLEAQERAQILITEGDALAIQAQHCGAADNYQAAAQALRPGAPATAALRAEAVKKFARSGVACARELAAKGSYEQARTRLTAILADDMAPNDKPAQTLLEQLDDPDRHNPALTPLHADNVDKVNKLLVRAEHFTELGQFDAAEAAYNQVLAIDGTNKAARRGIERVQRHITEYYKSARDETRLRMLNAVDRTWERSVPTAARITPIAHGEDVVAGGGTVAEKLRGIMLPRIALSDASIADAVAHLRRKSIELDPEPDERLRGVNIIWNGAGGDAPQAVNVDLRNVSLGDALLAVCDAAGVRYRSDGAIIVVSRSGGGGMETRQFRVPPGFLSTSASALPTDTAASDPFAAPDPAAAKPKIGRLDAQTYLENNGIQFPDGARAGYNPSANLLTVTNTADNLELVASLMDTQLTKTQRQALVEVILLKASQQNLREAGGDFWLGAFSMGGSDRVFGAGGTYGNQQNGLSVTAPGNFGTSAFTPITVPFNAVQGPVTAGLRSSYELTRNRNIDDLIAISNSTSGSAELNRSPFIAGVGGMFTSPQFLAMLRGLDQKKGIDLSVANKVIVKSGQRATAFSGRDFSYPTEFDPPQIPQTVAAPQALIFDPTTGAVGVLTGTLGQAPVTPATPSSFDTRQIGSSIDVEATIGEDGYTVDLNLAVTFTEFDGFINYGTPILSNNENSSQNTILTDNRIIQPVFSRAAANAQVLIYDGQSVAIGGLTGQKTETVEDAVPLWSKIPLVGKFFTTDMTRDTRMAVIYFVTVTIVDPAGEKANAAAQVTAPEEPPAELPFDPALLDAVRADSAK